MLVIGIILLIVGAILLAAPHIGGPPAAGNLAALGWLLALAGVILIVVALVAGSDVDVESLVGGGVAMAAAGSMRDFHSAGADEPAVPVAGGVTDRQPVLVAFILGAVPLVLAALTGLADVFTGVPDWVVPTLTTIGTLTTGLAALWARSQVTPVALPRLDDDTPLVPMTVREDV